MGTEEEDGQNFNWLPSSFQRRLLLWHALPSQPQDTIMQSLEPFLSQEVPRPAHFQQTLPGVKIYSSKKSAHTEVTDAARAFRGTVLSKNDTGREER